MHRGAVALIVIVAGGLNACGGGAEESSSASTTRTVLSVESTTSSSTDVEGATSVPADTSGSSPTSTLAPATTEAASIEDEVRAAAIRNYDSYWECLRNPATCVITERTIKGSAAFDGFSATISGLMDGGFFVGDEDVGYMVIESIEVRDDHTLVASCWWSTGVLYVQPAIDGAQPVVQNDTPESGRQADEYVQDPSDGEWRLRSSEVLTTTVGDNECPPES